MTSEQEASHGKVTGPEATAPLTSLPPPYQLARGYYISRALLLVANLAIADLLKDGPRDYGDLAKSTGTHPPSLNRVMRLLASVGVFAEQENGNFALTSLGRCLRTGVPGSSRAMVMHFAGLRIQDSWRDLEDCVRTASQHLV